MSVDDDSGDGGGGGGRCRCWPGNITVCLNEGRTEEARECECASASLCARRLKSRLEEPTQ